MRRYYGSRDLSRMVGGLSGVLLVHARDDTEVPFAASERLIEALAEPRRLIAVERGGHTGIQHDVALQDASLDWIVAGMADASEARRS